MIRQVASAVVSAVTGGGFKPLYDLAGVRRDWKWSEQFMPEVKQILGGYTLKAAPLQQDRQEATDLIVLHGRSPSIAVRIRRSVPPGCERQFTLRSDRATNAKSELDKIIDGRGDWLFYGIESGSHPGRLGSWAIVDLAAFRAHLIRHGDRIVRGKCPNADGVSTFEWFDLGSFPSNPPILIGASESWGTRKTHLIAQRSDKRANDGWHLVEGNERG